MFPVKICFPCATISQWNNIGTSFKNVTSYESFNALCKRNLLCFQRATNNLQWPDLECSVLIYMVIFVLLTLLILQFANYGFTNKDILFLVVCRQKSYSSKYFRTYTTYRFESIIDGSHVTLVDFVVNKEIISKSFRIYGKIGAMNMQVSEGDHLC